MATQRQHSSSKSEKSKSEKEDLRYCRQRMRWLMEGLGHSLPGQQVTFQSALLLNFHRASHRVGLTHSLGSAFTRVLLPKTQKTATPKTVTTSKR